jgi:hypothetical protein
LTCFLTPSTFFRPPSGSLGLARGIEAGEL